MSSILALDVKKIMEYLQFNCLFFLLFSGNQYITEALCYKHREL